MQIEATRDSTEVYLCCHRKSSVMLHNGKIANYSALIYSILLSFSLALILLPVKHTERGKENTFSV